MNNNNVEDVLRNSFKVFYIVDKFLRKKKIDFVLGWCVVLKFVILQNKFFRI